METVIKTYIGLFFMVFLFTTGITIVKAQNNAENARDFRNQVCIQLEDSNYEKSVVNNLLVLAENKGYELNIKLKNDDNRITNISGTNYATEENTSDIDGAVVELKYYYELPIFESRTEHMLYGIAR